MTQERKAELMKYKAIVSVFTYWLSNGFISTADYTKIEEFIAAKYRVFLCSIWRELL